MSIIYRTITAEDIDGASALEQASFADPWPRSAFEEIVDKPDADYYLAEDTESGQKLCVTVVSTQHYPDAESLLASEDIRVAMSSTNDPVVGAERIRSFPGYREGILRNGVWAIRLKDPGLS